MVEGEGDDGRGVLRRGGDDALRHRLAAERDTMRLDRTGFQPPRLLYLSEGSCVAQNLPVQTEVLGSHNHDGFVRGSGANERDVVCPSGDDALRRRLSAERDPLRLNRTGFQPPGRHRLHESVRRLSITACELPFCTRMYALNVF